MISTLEELNMSNSCTICLADIEETNITTLPCGHSFHYSCIFTWNAQHNTCPFCRQPLIPGLNNENNDLIYDSDDDEESDNDIPDLVEDNNEIANIHNNIIDLLVYSEYENNL